MSKLDYKPFYQRNLPHIQPLRVALFVTFRLAGSLPRAVQEQWLAEKRYHEALMSQITDPNERAHREQAWQRRWFYRFEVLLNRAAEGPVWLKDERIADLVAESLHYRDGKVYRLDAYCIMPNHVHVVFEPLPVVGQTVSLSYILHSLKGYTSRRANLLLGRSGAFWEHESYDHYVRNERGWERIIAYVLNNPIKAGFVQDWHDWKWSYFRYAL